MYGAGSLSEVVQFLRGDKVLEPVRSANGWFHAGFGEQDLDFGEVKGQQHVKRAVEVAAAGGHNILTAPKSSRAGVGQRLSGLIKPRPLRRSLMARDQMRRQALKGSSQQ